MNRKIKLLDGEIQSFWFKGERNPYECKSVSRIYKLGEGNLLSVDQSGINGDKTALCFSRYDGEKIIVLKTEIIEPQNDIDKFINRNIDEIYKVFGISEELL